MGKRNGRARTGVESKRRRARIARKVRVRAQVALVHAWADGVTAMQRDGCGPVSPFLPFSDREPAVVRAWISRGGSASIENWPRPRRFALSEIDWTTFFDTDRWRHVFESAPVGSVHR